MKLRQVRLKINGKDILPYIIIGIIIILMIVSQLGFRGIINFRYSKEFSQIALFVMIIGVINYFKTINMPKGVDLRHLISTSDIRTPTVAFRGFINQGTDISFVKFYFSNDCIYMYYRSFLKVYDGPLILKEKEKTLENDFYIKKFNKSSKNEMILEISTRTGLTQYDLILRNVGDKDVVLLDKEFNKLL